MINTKAIKKKMIDEDITVNDLAKAIGKKPVTVRQKIAGYRPMFLDESEIIQVTLNIPDEQFCNYFFL